MNKVFNTPFELSLRTLLILSCDDTPKTADMIAAIDFMTVYGQSFGLSKNSLHGNNSYKFSEFTSRISLIKQAIKALAVDGLICIASDNSEFLYIISPQGNDYISSLKSEYAEEYSRLAKQTLLFIAGKSTRSVIGMINKQAVTSLKTGGHNG